ncbi:MAG: hypothetical protein ACFCU3_07925 [Verrucomicrobiales bacterium]
MNGVKRAVVILLVAGWSLSVSSCGSSNSESKGRLRIAFGSGSHQNNSQAHWEEIKRSRPDLWVWTGNVVQAQQKDLASLTTALDRQLRRPEYEGFRESTPVTGIWHHADFRFPKGDTHSNSEKARGAFLRFLSPLPYEPVGEGLYGSFVIKRKAFEARIVLLDTSTYARKDGNPDAPILLGAEQWGWLQTMLATARENWLVIVTPLPFFTEEFEGEKWGDYGFERAKLLRMLGVTLRDGVIILSGGRELAEILSTTSRSVGYPLYEVSVGNLNRALPFPDFGRGQYRVDEPFFEPHYGHIDLGQHDAVLAIRDMRGRSVALVSIGRKDLVISEKTRRLRDITEWSID